MKSGTVNLSASTSSNAYQQPDERVGSTFGLLSLETVKNDKKMRFFTGITFFQFCALFKFLGESVHCLDYWRGIKTADRRQQTPPCAKKRQRKTNPQEELFLTLVRLRRGYTCFALAHFFEMSESHVRSIFRTWLQFLYQTFNTLRDDMFPDRSHMKKFMPAAFKSFKNIRCVVDCTDCYVQMPSNFQQQGNLYSKYKHHHTYKCLIGVNPNGAAVFVSNLFEGAISDRDLFEKCGIMKHLNPGDLVVADRGFTVRDMLQQIQVNLNIPPFLGGRDKLTPQEELLTRRIAKVRIHVERFNERLKKFRLIAGTIPLSLAPVANQAVFLACCLVNFQKPLVV
jgi:hypothetical protein